MDHQPKIKWTLWLGLATLCFVASVLDIGPLASLRNTLFRHDPSDKWVIVFDGGSTGTRIHVFHFHNSTDTGQITLKDEYFEEVRPGLSSYAHKPTKAALSVLGLLELAKSRVPPSLWGETPVLLKATAGLRLLDTQLATGILDAVQSALSECPFWSADNSVGVLDGQDEGLYAWHTLNFLLGRLSGDESVVSLDLGGGSTQVTFLPRERETLLSAPPSHVVHQKGLHSRPLYTHSYLGLGLMAAREQILNLSTDGTSPGRIRCVHPKAEFTWKYDSKEYKIRSHPGEMSDMQRCVSSAASFLASHGSFFGPDELRRRDVYALSYYFDRAKDLGAIGERGGTLTVGAFMDSCRRQCVRHDTARPLLCLDCSYISALYTHALGLPHDKTLHLVTEINGFETSWALGAAFDTLS